MGFGVGASAFMDGAMRGYAFADNMQRRAKDDEFRDLQMQGQKDQMEREKAYRNDMEALGNQFSQAARVQDGTDAQGNPIYKSRPLTYDEQLNYANQAAQIGVKYLKTTPEQMASVGKAVEDARREGTMDAIKAIQAGDVAGGIERYNRYGNHQVDPSKVSVQDSTIELPGGVTMPTKIVDLGDGNKINTAEWLTKGLAFEKMYDASAQAARDNRNHDFQTAQTDKELSFRADQAAADRAQRERLANAQLSESRAARADARQERADARRDARIPAEVLVSRWYANDATPEERATYDAIKRRGGDQYVKFRDSIAEKLATNLAYANQPDKVVRDSEQIASGVYGVGAAPAAGGGFGIGAGRGPAPAAAQPAGVPKPGAVMDGFRFKGGDPSDPKSWEKI